MLSRIVELGGLVVIDGVVQENVGVSDGSRARRCHQEQRAMLKGRDEEDSVTKTPGGGENRLRGTQEGMPGLTSRPWPSERILAIRHDPLKIAAGVAGGYRVRRVSCFSKQISCPSMYRCCFALQASSKPA